MSEKNLQTQPDGVDMLRQSLEQEYRFGTAFQGYNKAAVQQYIEELKTNQERKLQTLFEEKESLRLAKDGLEQQLAEQERTLREDFARELENVKADQLAELTALEDKLAEEQERARALQESAKEPDAERMEALLEQARSEERSRLESESEIREGVLENLRLSNSRLTEDNRKKQLEIASLKQELEEVKGALTESRSTLKSLSESLSKLMCAKLKESTELMGLWQEEFAQVLQAEEEKIQGTGE